MSKWKTSRNYRHEEYRENSKTDASKNDLKSALGKISLRIYVYISERISN